MLSTKNMRFNGRHTKKTKSEKELPTFSPVVRLIEKILNVFHRLEAYIGKVLIMGTLLIDSPSTPCYIRVDG